MLSDDILPDIPAMAEFLYGKADKRTCRRIRHLIDKHQFPVKKVGCRYESRKSWIARLYDQPDEPEQTAA